MKIIFIEKYELNIDVINRIKKITYEDKDEFKIVVFSNKDESMINKFNTNIEIINFTKEVKSSKVSEFNEEEFKNTYEIIKNIKNESEIEEFKIMVNSLFGNIYMVGAQYSIVKNFVKKLIYNNKISKIYIFGKNNCRYKYSRLFNKSILRNEEMISYVINEIRMESEIEVERINVGNIIKNLFSHSIEPYLQIYAKNRLHPLIYLKRNNIKSNNIVIIRSFTHIKLLLKLSKGNVINLDECDFIIDKKYLKEIPNLSDYKIAYINISIMSVLRTLLQFKLRKKIKTLCNIKGIYSGHLYSVCIMNKEIVKKLEDIFITNEYDNYYCFEETNFYGALISYIAKKYVNNTITIQHGVTVSYGYTMPLVSNKRWVWGKEFKNRYIELGEDDNNIVNISNYLNDIKSIEKIKEKKNLDILIAPEMTEIVEPKSWIEDILSVIEKSNISQIRKVTISIHPFYGERYLLEKYFKNIGFKYNLEIVTGLTQEIIDFNSIVITGNTTVGYESVIRGKRIVFYNKYNDINYTYLKHRFIYKAKNKQELYNGIQWTINTSERELEEIRKDFIEKYL